MRVAKYFSNSDIRLEDMSRPVIGPGEILVKVEASGICGTDVMEWYRIKKAPRVLGHEISGTIIETQSDAFRPGQRVFVSHHVPCDVCKYCRAGHHTACETLHTGNYDPGGYSEFVRVPKLNVEKGVYPLPDSVSFNDGTMIEPLACALRGQRVIDVKKGQTVLVLGSGVSGLLNVLVAKQRGAKVIATDVDAYRLSKAKECGADEAWHPDELPALKAEKIIVCTGAYSAVEQAFRCVDRKGVILLFAIPNRPIEVPSVDFWRNEITLTSSYGAAGQDLEESLRAIANSQIPVKHLITHTLPLTEIQKGFQLVVEGKQTLKVVLQP
ncbi:MAG: alcohol dehydrogenase catalytic domain-containing protein [Elusimicrobia bacterium]|nr:alcohol dehydrogenase catalytic domain-containing protein [Elusimicrobiota bacterium]